MLREWPRRLVGRAMPRSCQDGLPRSAMGSRWIVVDEPPQFISDDRAIAALVLGGDVGESGQWQPSRRGRHGAQVKASRLPVIRNTSSLPHANKSALLRISYARAAAGMSARRNAREGPATLARITAFKFGRVLTIRPACGLN